MKNNHMDKSNTKITSTQTSNSKATPSKTTNSDDAARSYNYSNISNKIKECCNTYSSDDAERRDGPGGE